MAYTFASVFAFLKLRSLQRYHGRRLSTLKFFLLSLWGTCCLRCLSFATIAGLDYYGSSLEYFGTAFR